MRKLMTFVGLLLLMALFYVGLVSTGTQDAEERQPPQSLPAVGTARGSDLDTLISVFGLPVPYGSKQGEGQVTDAAIGSLRARLLTWQGSDGLVTAAVRPAQAASLLRREDFPLGEARQWLVGGVPLMVCAAESGVCAYYQSEDAAFSLYLPQADTETFLTLINRSVRLFPSDQP